VLSVTGSLRGRLDCLAVACRCAVIFDLAVTRLRRPKNKRGGGTVYGRAAEAGPIVDHFRQILLWPLELMPVRADEQIQKHWHLLERATPATPWREVADEFTPDAELFQERHYSEFVTFLPRCVTRSRT